jgi:hypothetical protein
MVLQVRQVTALQLAHQQDSKFTQLPAYTVGLLRLVLLELAYLLLAPEHLVVASMLLAVVALQLHWAVEAVVVAVLRIETI